LFRRPRLSRAGGCVPSRQLSLPFRVRFPPRRQPLLFVRVSPPERRQLSGPPSRSRPALAIPASYAFTFLLPILLLRCGWRSLALSGPDCSSPSSLAALPSGARGPSPGTLTPEAWEKPRRGLPWAWRAVSRQLSLL
jgi:hypothetical protein